jgi:hypothetical protein
MQNLERTLRAYDPVLLGVIAARWDVDLETSLNEWADEIPLSFATSGDAVMWENENGLPTIRVLVNPRFEIAVEENEGVEVVRRASYPAGARAWRLRRG